MADTVDRQPLASREAEMKQHSDDRFDQFERELARQNDAQKMKVKILSAFVAFGLIVWAWAALR